MERENYFLLPGLLCVLPVEGTDRWISCLHVSAYSNVVGSIAGLGQW